MSTTPVAKSRVKSVVCAASALAVGIAFADYIEPVQVPVSAAQCCQTTWDCGIFQYCVYDFDCNFTGNYFGRCES
jgi:hypothetical protein